MRPECIPKPTKEHWVLTVLEFQRTANFPHCLRAVDGKNIPVIKPGNSGSLFCNFIDFFPMVLTTLADTNYCFMYADIGS
jgi:hypothetical protein